MIENPPLITKDTVLPSEVLLKYITDSQNHELLSKIEKEYYYWDKIKYLGNKNLPAEHLWQLVKFTRLTYSNNITFEKCKFSFPVSNYMQQLLHEFDINFGGTISVSSTISEKNKQYYLINSIMEEAIASSQMEGANTTRKVAKEMLQKQIKPKDKSQQMIYNNYNTICFLSEHKDDDLSPELLLEIHRLISEKTLDNPENEGSFRKDDNIYILNGITGEVAHEPPSYTQIEPIIMKLCHFANNDEVFIHPIIKAIIIHFMISFLHPFVDGNGRTARSLFYWYMLKKGYWMTEFLSISRIIYKKKGQYEKAFLYTEHDNLDLGYFIHFNLNVMKEAYEDLKIYLERKSNETNALLEFRNIPGLNERQAHIIKIIQQKPGTILECKNLVNTLGITIKTARKDLEGLVELGLLSTIPLNKRLIGYTKSDDFETILKESVL